MKQYELMQFSNFIFKSESLKVRREMQINGVTIGSLDDVSIGAVPSFFQSIRNTLDFDFDDETEG